MRSFRIAIALAVVALMPLAALAESPKYTYIEGGFVEIEPDDARSDDGLFFGGSFGGENWHVLGSYDDAGDYTLWYVGGGWHGLLGERADVVAEAKFIDAEVSSGRFSASEDGYRLTGGIRWMALDFLEVDGFLHYTDIEDSDESLELRVIGNIKRLGIGASWETNDVDITKLFVRFNFK